MESKLLQEGSNFIKGEKELSKISGFLIVIIKFDKDYGIKIRLNQVIIKSNHSLTSLTRCHLKRSLLKKLRK